MAWKRTEQLPLERVLRAAARVQLMIGRAKARELAKSLEAAGHHEAAQRIYATLVAPPEET